MPIQEVLTGVTFPGSGLVNVSTLKNPLQYFGSLLALWSKGDAGLTPVAGVSEAVTSSAISGGVGTVGLSLANVNLAYTIGQNVTFAGITNATALNGTFKVTALGSNTISVATAASNVSSASESAATVVPAVVTAWGDNSSYVRNFNVLSDAAWPPAVAAYTSSINSAITQPMVVPVGINGPHKGDLKQTYSSALDFPATTPFSVVAAMIPGAAPGGVYPTDIGNISGTLAANGGWSLCAYQTGTVKQPTLRLVNTRATAECSVSTTATVTPGTPIILHAINTGTGTAAGLSMYINGVAQALTTQYDTLGGATTVTGNAISAPGAAATGGGIGTSSLLELFVVNKAMTSTDVALMDAYLNAKWGIHI
jgi:hypothetical protein